MSSIRRSLFAFGAFFVVALLSSASPASAQQALCDGEIKSIRVRAVDDAVIVRVADLPNDPTPDWNGEKVLKICTLGVQDGNVGSEACKVFLNFVTTAQATNRVVEFNVNITTPGSCAAASVGFTSYLYDLRLAEDLVGQ